MFRLEELAERMKVEQKRRANVAWVFRPEAVRTKQKRQAKSLTSKEMSYIKTLCAAPTNLAKAAIELRP
jgi:hypothetical protein